MSIKIISDSSCDFTKKEYEEKNVSIIPFYITFDGATYQREVTEISVDDIYKKMMQNDHVYPKTSTPNPSDYYKEILKEVELNNEVICICITQSFSSSFQSACIAKDMVLADYPNAKIEIIDSKINTIAQGLFVDEICKMRDKGMAIEEIVAEAKALIPCGKIFFTVGNLDYLAHGGRIGKVASLIGKGLMIKPIIVLEEGTIQNEGFGIGRKRTLSKVIDKIKKFFEKSNENPNDYQFAVGYGDDEEEAMSFREKVHQAFKDLGYEISCKIAKIGAAIAVHTGPHALGLGFVKLYKEKKEVLIAGV